MVAAPIRVPAGTVTLVLPTEDALMVGLAMRTLVANGEIDSTMILMFDRVAKAMVGAAMVGAIGVGAVKS